VRARKCLPGVKTKLGTASSIYSVSLDGVVDFYPSSINALSNSLNDADEKACLARVTNPVIFATAKLTPLRLRSGCAPGIARGEPEAKNVGRESSITQR